MPASREGVQRPSASEPQPADASTDHGCRNHPQILGTGHVMASRKQTIVETGGAMYDSVTAATTHNRLVKPPPQSRIPRVSFDA